MISPAAFFERVAIGGEQSLDDWREGAKGQEILSAVINFEHVADIVANSLTDFAVKQIKRGQLLAADEIAIASGIASERTTAKARTIPRVRCEKCMCFSSIPGMGK